MKWISKFILVWGAALAMGVWAIMTIVNGAPARKPAANSIAQTYDFHPNYPVHIIPDFKDADGNPIYKGLAAETDVRKICAGKGIYKNVPHQGGTYSQTHRLTQSKGVKSQVLAQSGVPEKDARFYEDDHDLPLSLGGSDSIENRWAQPRFGKWNAAQKDLLENEAQLMVCSGSVALSVAQGWFETKITPDWRVPYCALVKSGAIKEDPACAELH